MLTAHVGHPLRHNLKISCLGPCTIRVRRSQMVFISRGCQVVRGTVRIGPGRTTTADSLWSPHRGLNRTTQEGMNPSPQRPGEDRRPDRLTEGALVQCFPTLVVTTYTLRLFLRSECQDTLIYVRNLSRGFLSVDVSTGHRVCI